MSSDLLTRNSVLDVATPFSDSAIRSFDVDRELQARKIEKQQAALGHALEKKSELLASPEKIEGMVVNSLQDVYPLVKKPKAVGYDRVAGIDDDLQKADHPMAGIGQVVKDRFKAALQDKSLALANPIEVLNAVKQDVLNQKDGEGKSLLEKSHEYKMQKDEGGLFSFHPSKFIPGMEPYSDKNTVALPGYEEYKAKHEQNSTSITESAALGAAGALVGAGLTALTGGAAVPAAALAGRMALAAAVAIPEFKVFDAAANLVKNSDFGQSEDTGSLAKLGAELALGVVAAGVTHKVGKGLLSTGLTKAIEAGKVSEEAVGMLRKTGLATAAIDAFEKRTAAAKELASVESALNEAKAVTLKTHEKAIKTQSILAASEGADEAGMGLSEFINHVSGAGDKQLTRPIYAEVMGVSEDTLKEAKTNPVALFSHIEDPEIEASIMEDIKNGMSAQRAVLKGFEQEASIKLEKSGRLEELESMIAEEAAANEAGKKAGRLGYEIGGKAPKGVSVKGGKSSLENLNPMEKLLSEVETVDRTDQRLGYGLGGKAPAGKSVEGGKTLGLDNPAVEERIPSRYETVSESGNGKKVSGGVVKPEGPTSLDNSHNVALPEVVKVNDVPRRYEVTSEIGKDGKVRGGNTVPDAPTSLDNSHNFIVEKAVKDKLGTRLENGVNTVALAGAGLLAGGMALFGMPEKSEASVSGAVAKGVESIGKKLLDGGLEIMTNTIESAISKISNSSIKSHVAEEVEKYGMGASTKPAGFVVNKLMEATKYNDAHTVLKSMEEMGIDTSTRIGYHGTPSAESSLKGHAEEYVRSGLYNDEGEFAKYFTHDPQVSAGYAGQSGLEPTVKRAELYKALKAELPKYTGNLTKDQQNKLEFLQGVKQDMDSAYKLTDGQVTKLYSEFPELHAGFDVATPNIQKSLLVTKKTYPMEGPVPEDVKNLIDELLPHLPVTQSVRNANEAWKALGMLKEVKAAKDFSSELESTIKQYGIETNSASSVFTERLSQTIEAIESRPDIPESVYNRLRSIMDVTEITTPKKAANDVLRSLGYDSITHLGRGDGFVTIALKAGVEQPFFNGKNLADLTLKSVAALAASIPVLSLLSPQDAEASTGALAGKVVAEGVIKTLQEEIGGDLKNVFKVLFEKRLVSEPVAPGTTSLPVMQQQFYQAPSIGRSLSAVNEVVGKTKSPFDGLARFMSPKFFSDVYGTTSKSISVQLASMQNAMTNNINNATTVAESIIKNVKGIKPEHTQEIAEFMKPIQAAYDEVAIPLRGAELETIKTQEVIKNVEQALKDGKYTPEDAETLLKEHREKLKNLQALWHEYNPKFAEVDSMYAKAKEELIQKYPSARISFAVEEPGLLETRKELFSVDERAAVARFREFYNHYKLRANEVGMETISGPYINHSRDNTEVQAALAEKLERFGVSVNKGIPLTEFFSRSKYSKQMLPDITRNAFEYISDTERRIQGADFWRKGRQDGWHAFSQNEFIKSNKVWSDFFDRLKEGMVPPPQTTMNTLANRYAAVETLRLLAFLPSAPFKHLFKNEGTWATLGFTHSMKMIPDAVTTSVRNTVNDILRAKGLNEKMLPKGALDDFTRSMIKQRSMVNPLGDLEKHEGIVKGVDKWLDQLNSVGGIGIRAVEAFDRSHTVQSALDMALKKGMTAEQAMFGIYDTILKNNFLGGSLNPSWMHNPKIRALALFQNTPFKILERRLSNAYKTGQDVKTAWGVIKSQNVEKTLAELTDLGTWVKGAQNEFKKNMIFDAITSQKDAFGNSISKQFMKEFLITGAILGAGSATGVDFHSHSFHIPFIKGKAEPTLATSPIVDATWKTVAGKPSPGHDNDEDKEFFTSRFLRHWLGSSGGAQPLLLHKFRRITSDDIPAIYKDSPLRYLFSVPSTEHAMK